MVVLCVWLIELCDTRTEYNARPILWHCTIIRIGVFLCCTVGTGLHSDGNYFVSLRKKALDLGTAQTVIRLVLLSNLT